MLRRLKLFMVVSFGLAFSLAPATPATAFDPFAQSCQGQAKNSSAVCIDSKDNTTNPIAGPGGIINTAATIIALVGGAVAVIMIIVSGIRYITSGGNPETAKSARNGMALALAGLAVIALAWAITTFISDRILP